MKLKLKRLLLQGFKSFKDRTVVQFDEGITGIVGPNGCGKSNIVDALFWVMGEQSAKHLRGKSMQDVIFAGSDKYSPAPWAEVTLVLGNEGGKSIHIGTSVARPTEIQITRKLYRNGESEYRINGMPARLKDVQEVFMDTGAGAKSYSIIAQGEINRLVQAKPEERRLMIEEVAGITKFKLRRRDSLKKIEQTQQNLDRLKDLQNEIDKNLKNLKRQAEKAEEARALKERIRKYDLVVSSHQVFDTLRDYRDGKNFVRTTQLEIEGNAARKLSLENSIAQERIQKDEMTIHLDDKQAEFNQSSKVLAALEERQKYIQKAIKEKSQLLDRFHNEKEESLKQLEGRKARELQLVSDLKQLEDQASLEVNFDELQELVENLREQVQLKQADLDERSEVIRDLENERYSLDQTLFKNNSRLEEYSTQLQDLSKEIELIEEQFSGFSKSVSTERETVLGLQSALPILESRIANLKSVQDEIKNQIKEKENLLRQQQKMLLGKEGRLSSLIEIRRSLQGLAIGTQKFLSTGPKSEYARVGQLVECSDEFTPAVQALLENLFESLVGQDGGKELCQWSNSHQTGGWAYCLPISDADFSPKENLERLKLCNLGNIWPLQDVVKVNNPQFQDTLAALLDGMYIAESLDIEKIQALSTDIKVRALASKDGKLLIKDNGTYRVWSARTNEDASAGEVARNNEIKALEESLVKEREDFLGLEMDVELLRSKLNENENELDQVRLDFSNQRADYASKKAALDSKQQNIEQGQGRLQILKSRKDEISHKRLELLEQDENLQEKYKLAQAKLKDLTSDLATIQDQFEIVSSEYEENLDSFNQKKAFHQSFQMRLKSSQDQILDIAEQIQKLQSRILENEQNFQALQTEIGTLEDQFNEGDLESKRLAEALADEEDILSNLKDQLAELLVGMQEREDEIKKLSQIINKAEKELAAQAVKMEQLVTVEAQIARDIFEKYRIDLRKIIGTALEMTSSDYEGLSDNSTMFIQETENGPIQIACEEYEFVRRYGQDLKDCSQKLKTAKSSLSALGEINWQAIEDYERQKLRYDFLTAQEDELKKSMIDLQTAIAQIDQKCRLRFQEAYSEVNERFTKVFPIIFGGGNAQLQIVGDLDSPECGIDIIAQPPGKKMQNINLMSGGEKALTAVSLIFSIFLVKPSPFCLLDEVDAPLDDANVGRFNELLREMSNESQFILITHNKKTMELNDTLYGVTMQEPGISTAVSVHLH